MKTGKEKKPSATFTFTTGFCTVTLEADDRGLTAINLDASSGSGSAGKKNEMPGDPLLQTAARQIGEYLQGSRTVFDLPLSITGTDFQKQVWEIIRKIPYGRTLSYGDIARRLGSAAKARAVGGAAHANNLPLVIPCHRVIGADGSLTGFGSGLGLKKKLLDLEKKHR